MVIRKLPSSHKPPKATDAQARKSRVARNLRENEKPRAETVTVSDDCCTTPGILWMDQGYPCRDDCHYSDYSWRKAEVIEGYANPDGSGDGNWTETPVRKDQLLLETACGHCGTVNPTPTDAAAHVMTHKPEKLQPTEGWGWPGTYVDGPTWGRYSKKRVSI